MGMEQTVTFAGSAIPSWEAVGALLSQHGFPVQMRMIDGQLAFPDETPPADWRELRLGTPAGMITVRREADRVLLVTWGNADAGMQQAWNALTWAFAEAGRGAVLTADGPRSAADYRQAVDLPTALRNPK